jgi:hypothetical protein
LRSAQHTAPYADGYILDDGASVHYFLNRGLA